MRRRNGIYLFFACLMFFAAALFGYQRHYINQHLPLIQAGLAQALGEGDQVLAQIGTPPNAKLMEPIKRTIHKGGRSGKWQDTDIGATWLAFYDAPGRHSDCDYWYREHLMAIGWKVRYDPLGSEVQTEFYRDKWLLAVEHEAWFEGREPHARFHLRLNWDYRHSFE